MILHHEIDIHINRLKNNKAAGVDGIAGAFLKYAASELNELLQVLFNHVFEKGDFPSLWAEGIIHSIHKKSQGQHGFKIASSYCKGRLSCPCAYLKW